MEKTAQKIMEIDSWEEALTTAGDLEVDSEEDYKNEISIMYFADGSGIKFDGLAYEKSIIEK